MTVQVDAPDSKAGAAHDTVTETTPLLTQDDSVTSETPSPKKGLSRFGIIMVIIVLLALLQTGDQLIDSPMTRIMEAIACFRYWERADPSNLLTDAADAGPGAIFGTRESMCKENAIQAEVAMLRSWQYFFEGIPALVLAVPFGWLQDKYGRRPFLIIGMASFLIKLVWIMIVLWFWQSFDLRWTWLSSVHAVLMAGAPGITALYYTIIADITAEEERATIFLRMGACNLAWTFVVPPVSAWLMTYNPWIPWNTGMVLTIIGTAITLMIPETLNYRSLPDSTSNPTSTQPASEAVAGPPELAVELLPVSANFAQRLFLDVKDASAFLWADYRVPLTILPFLLHILFMATTPLLVQYASKRYELTISTATLFVTVRAGVHILLLMVILPYISSLLMERFGFSGKHKDLTITRASMVVMALGWLLIGAAPTVWPFVFGQIITSLGIGAMFTLRSLLTSLVPNHYIARAYSVVCVVDTLGFMLGVPLLAELFTIGMRLDGSGIGLPFFVLGCATFFFVLLLLFVRLRKDEAQMVDALDESS